MDVRVGLWRRLRTENWCFWTVVLEKTLESPLDCKEIQPVHSEEDQSWDFFRRNEAKAETPVHAKSWLIGKDSDAGRDWEQEEKGTAEDEMAGWHHWLDGRESEWTPGVGDGQGGLACCDSWGRRVGHDWVTELNWTEEGNRVGENKCGYKRAMWPILVVMEMFCNLAPSLSISWLWYCSIVLKILTFTTSLQDITFGRNWVPEYISGVYCIYIWMHYYNKMIIF